MKRLRCKMRLINISSKFYFNWADARVINRETLKEEKLESFKKRAFQNHSRRRIDGIVCSGKVEVSGDRQCKCHCSEERMGKNCQTLRDH